MKDLFYISIALKHFDKTSGVIDDRLVVRFHTDTSSKETVDRFIPKYPFC